MAKTPLFSRRQVAGVVNVEDREVTTGNVWFVHSGTGSDGTGYGESPDSPTATIQAAIDLATASQADTVYVMPGHTENITGAGTVDLDEIGLSVIGLGFGSNRPTLTFTETDSTILLSGASTRLSNVRCVAGKDAVVEMVVMSADTEIDNILFLGTSSFQWNSAVTLTDTEDNFSIKDCVFEQKTDPDKSNGGANTGGIYIEDSENIIIDGCTFYDQIETACIHNDTTECKNLWVTNCRWYCTLADMVPFIMETGATGSVEGSGGAVPAADDVTDAKLWGTLGATFWIGKSSGNGNDSGGGQGAIPAIVCT